MSTKMSKLRVLVATILATTGLMAALASPVAASCSSGYLDIYEYFNKNGAGEGASLRICHGANVSVLNNIHAGQQCRGNLFSDYYWGDCISSVQLTSIGTAKSVCLWTNNNYSGSGLRIVGNWTGNFEGGLSWMHDVADSIQWNC